MTILPAPCIDDRLTLEDCLLVNPDFRGRPNAKKEYDQLIEDRAGTTATVSARGIHLSFWADNQSIEDAVTFAQVMKALDSFDEE